MTDKDMLAGLVRGLEWDDRGYEWSWWADTVFGRGTYQIRCEGGIGYLVDFDGVTLGEPHDTLEAAKSAAQADYTARTLAALDLDALATRANSAQVGGLKRFFMDYIAADMTEELDGEYVLYDDVAALVGAAYEAAAGRCDEHARHEVGRERAMLQSHAAYFRALTPADAQAALGAALKKARREGLEMAAKWHEAAELLTFDTGGSIILDRSTTDACAAAIRKLGDGE